MAKDTRELIQNKFIELLNEVPLNQIGIKELAEACGINRNTFYYYYKNIPDLIESVIKSSVDNIIADHPPAYDALEDCFAAIISFAQDQKRAIYHIYDSTNRAIFERHLWKVCDYVINAYIDSLPPVPEPPTPGELEIIINFLKYEFFGFIMDWINKGMPDDVLMKAEILSNYLQEKLGLAERFH